MFDRFKEVIANLKNLLKAKKRANTSHHDPQTAHSPSQYQSPKWRDPRSPQGTKTI